MLYGRKPNQNGMFHTVFLHFVQHHGLHNTRQQHPAKWLITNDQVVTFLRVPNPRAADAVSAF